MFVFLVFRRRGLRSQPQMAPDSGVHDFDLLPNSISHLRFRLFLWALNQKLFLFFAGP